MQALEKSLSLNQSLLLFSVPKMLPHAVRMPFYHDTFVY